MNFETEKRLIDLAQRCQQRGFAWGQVDCNTIALDAISIITGREFNDVTGRYSSLTGAIRYQRRRRERLCDLLEILGAEIVRPKFERTGDIILVDRFDYQCAHVVITGKALSAGPIRGVEMLPLGLVDRQNAKTWRLQNINAWRLI